MFRGGVEAEVGEADVAASPAIWRGEMVRSTTEDNDEVVKGAVATAVDIARTKSGPAAVVVDSGGRLCSSFIMTVEADCLRVIAHCLSWR